MTNTNPRQRDMEAIGKDGCYFLSIIFLAESILCQPIDAIQTYYHAINQGWMTGDCFMTRPDALLDYLTGSRFSIRKEGPNYEPQTGELIILRYERKEGMRTWAHFVVGDRDRKVIYDPLGSSFTVSMGYLASMRVFRELS
jgi:hypothetical protein